MVVGEPDVPFGGGVKTALLGVPLLLRPPSAACVDGCRSCLLVSVTHTVTVARGTRSSRCSQQPARERRRFVGSVKGTRAHCNFRVMKVLVVSSGVRVPRPGADGIANVVLLAVPEMLRQGIDVTWASTADEPGALDLPVLRVNGPKDVAKAARKFDAVWVHQHHAYAAAAGGKAALTLHFVPSSSHADGNRVGPDWITYQEIVHAVRGAGSLTTCSALAARRAFGLFGVEANVVYPPVHPAFREVDATQKRRSVAFFGRLLPSKGVGVLLDLAEAGEIPGVLEITDFVPGEATLPSDVVALRSRLHSLARQGRVSLLPAAAWPHGVAGMAASASVVACPSLGDPLMISVEAQASGTRVVAYRDGGLVETAGPAVTLVESKDTEAFAAALHAAAAEPHVPDSARDWAAGTFSPARTAAAAVEALQKAASARR